METTRLRSSIQFLDLVFLAVCPCIEENICSLYTLERCPAGVAVVLNGKQLLPEEGHEFGVSRVAKRTEDRAELWFH